MEIVEGKSDAGLDVLGLSLDHTEKFDPDKFSTNENPDLATRRNHHTCPRVLPPFPTPTSKRPKPPKPKQINPQRLWR